MKSLLMVLFLMGGMAISNADAQSCKPGPPGCCAAKGTSADANAKQTLLPGTATLAACTPEQMAACADGKMTPEQMAACAGKKMSKKEMKECQVACQSKTAAATPAGQTQLVAQPANACKPAPASNTSKQ